jgi:hypothetical protein
MNLIQEIQDVRRRVLEIESVLSELVRRLESDDEPIERTSAHNYETIYPLTVNPAIFKGSKPTAIVFGDERVDVYKWKTVAEELMKHCNADAEKHVALMNLRGRIAGRERVFLAKEKSGMRSPIKIDENLYIETNYDTETLLRILMTRIFDVVNYDYSGISVSIRGMNPQKAVKI